MLNVSHALEHLNVDTHSVSRAICDVRELLMRNDNVCGNASKFVQDVFSTQVKFTDNNQAVLVVQSMVQRTVENEGEVSDEVLLLQQAKDYAVTFMNKPDNLCHFAVKDYSTGGQGDDTAVHVVEGMTTKVAVNVDGTIKKGGKGKLAAEMFDKFVTTAAVPMTNKEFVAVLMKELDMSKAGANTYLHNLKKAK